MVKRLATSPHDPLGITDSACKNQLVVVSVQYGPFNTYIPIRSTTIGKSRVARDPITLHTSWRSNSDIASVTRQTHLPKTHPVLWPEIYHTIVSSNTIGYPRMKASGESSTTKHRLLHASGPHPIPPPNDPKEHCDVLSMQIYCHLVIYRTTLVRTFQVVTICLVDKSEYPCGNLESSTCVTLNGSGIQLAVGPQPLWLRNHNSGLAHPIMVKRLATSPHDPLGITDSACKNQLVVVSVQYGPFNPYIPIGSTTIGKSRVAIDTIAMHTSWRSNSDIASVTSIGYPRMSASGESSTTMHRLLHASGSHPIPTPYDPKTNQYNQDLGLIHSTNDNHLESPKEGSSIDHQVTIYLHAQNITMFPTNETWCFAS
ncbi:hypothetical protein F511_15147 [Dorcoceras hygrometricum]|uniref:Uncharacterized protein n=1 Tax=Dorcoceras hygrometricum TaxID=472368 RepID=A0A2Z7BAW1_9LAMI|nr:hypothetical protein F511_15147 [Dorcoceras hygrometricum]